RGGGRLEQLAQLRDVVVDDLRRRQRRVVPPDRVHEALGPDDLVHVQDENREHRALPRASERYGPAALQDLQRPEQTELEIEAAGGEPGPGIVASPPPDGAPGACRARRASGA